MLPCHNLPQCSVGFIGSHSVTRRGTELLTVLCDFITNQSSPMSDSIIVLNLLDHLQAWGQLFSWYQLYLNVSWLMKNSPIPTPCTSVHDLWLHGWEQDNKAIVLLNLSPWVITAFSQPSSSAGLLGVSLLLLSVFAAVCVGGWGEHVWHSIPRNGVSFAKGLGTLSTKCG